MTKEFEQWIMEHLAPTDAPDDPAFPNHTDRDIWLVGFKAGFEYCFEEYVYDLRKQLTEYEENLKKLAENENKSRHTKKDGETYPKIK